MDDIAFFSRGLRRLEPEIGHLTGLVPSFRLVSPAGAAAVAGWGHKPSADRARRLAARTGLPYVAIEDGFLRSVKPGPSQLPCSMVIDRSGIYYDARQPSDLETLLATATFKPDEIDRARDLLALIARHRLSKYNHSMERPLKEFDLRRKLVLVIDQTVGDASIAGSMSDASTFERMVEAARTENPDATIIARLHPETVAGTKQGYLAEAARKLGLRVFSEPVSPWCLLDLRPHVYTVSSQFGFEALMSGCRVTCFGQGFFAGWGLTDDRIKPDRRGRTRSREELAAGVYLRYARYFDCWRRTPVSAETAVDQLAFLRRRFLDNSTPVIGYRIAKWKQKAVTAMLDGPAGPPRYTRNLKRATALARSSGASIAAWGISAIRLRPLLAAQGVSCIAVEDGFLRSVGLGAAFTQPLSLVFDRSGIYFDPTGPSDLETMLAGSDDLAADSARAAALREQIVTAKVTKYNLQGRLSLPVMPEPGTRDIVLVPGQVADDWAVSIGRPPGFPEGQNVNELLLQRVRTENPSAFLVFKPHPDVERLGRAGALSPAAEGLADVVARNTSLDGLLSACSRVETYSSLTGFETLLRGLPVTVHGRPFYAGWGLTSDSAPLVRRGRTRSLDELVTAALLRYARYWDPASGLPCPPELTLEHIREARASKPGLRQKLHTLRGWTVIMTRRAWKTFSKSRT